MKVSPGVEMDGGGAAACWPVGAAIKWTEIQLNLIVWYFIYLYCIQNCKDFMLNMTNVDNRKILDTISKSGHGFD